MNEYLATVPFDIYELSLFRLVVQHGSFTKAAEIAGLTQSAITRQVQGMEHSLGLKLLERTTRRVRATPAGKFLFQESGRLVGDVERSAARIARRICRARARRVVRIGVSRSIGPAYLPKASRTPICASSPQVGCTMSPAVTAARKFSRALETGELDLGVLCPPKRLPRTLSITHRFEDAFTLLVPKPSPTTILTETKSPKLLRDWLHKQNWLLIEEASQHRPAPLRAWMKLRGLRIEPTMQLDSFDLIINLVALGMGTRLCAHSRAGLIRQEAHHPAAADASAFRPGTGRGHAAPPTAPQPPLPVHRECALLKKGRLVPDARTPTFNSRKPATANGPAHVFSAFGGPCARLVRMADIAGVRDLQGVGR